MSTWHIYRVKNIETSECYIGRTTAPLERRKSWHYSNAKKINPETGEYLNNSKFSIALREVNPNYFEWEFISYTDDINKSYKLEGFFIKKFNSIKAGYNEKLNDRVPWNKGKKMSEEYRDNLKGENNPMYGKTQSKETKNKLSERMKVSQLGSDNHSARKVKCIELDKTWNSVIECAKELGIKPGSIVANCSGKNKSAYGYHFEYCDNKTTAKRNVDVSGGKNPMAKKVKCIDDNRIWDSASECAIEIGVTPSMIHAVCRGVRKSAKGYRFEYIIS